MDELAAQLLFVLSHFGLKSVIGFGVGAGANILSRFALQQPDKVSIKHLAEILNLFQMNNDCNVYPAMIWVYAKSIVFINFIIIIFRKL